MTCKEGVRTAELHQYLMGCIIGQDNAIQVIADYLGRIFSFTSRRDRVRGSLLILGPTGTGKTEIVIQSCKFIYRMTAALERLDLGEYSHPDAPVRLLGGPGVESTLGQALDRLERLGGGMLLMDELEKAHPSIWPVLLGFDAGRVTLHGGRTRSLESVVLVMTSNLGSAEAACMESAPDAAVERHVLRVAERTLRPEVFARFGERVVMRRLDIAAQRRIASLRLQEELRLRARDLGRPLLAAEGVAAFLAGKGFSAELGARPLRNTVEASVQGALMRGRVEEGACGGMQGPLTLLDRGWLMERVGAELAARSLAGLRVAPRPRRDLQHEHTTTE